MRRYDVLADLLVGDEVEAATLMRRELEKHYGGNMQEAKGQWIYATGTTPLCLVAHVDTVGRNGGVELRQSGNIVSNASNAPLGADDRAGCYAILRVLQSLYSANAPLPSVLITHGEESGGTGVKAWLASAVWSGKDNVFVELDRQGCGEWVCYYSETPPEVEAWLESFGWIERHGSYSDIADIASKLLVPCANLSVGYYYQHSAAERLHLDELELCIARVTDMACNVIGKLYPLPKEQYTRWDWNRQPITGSGGKYAAASYYDDSFDYCDLCDKRVKTEDLRLVSGIWQCSGCSGITPTSAEGTVECTVCNIHWPEEEMDYTTEGWLCANCQDICDGCGGVTAYGGWSTEEDRILCPTCAATDTGVGAGAGRVLGRNH